MQQTLPELIDVSPDGTVTCRQRIIGTFSQKLNLSSFPFDHAAFQIHFVMIGLHPAELALVSMTQLVSKGDVSGVGISPNLTFRRDSRRLAGSSAACPVACARATRRASWSR